MYRQVFEAAYPYRLPSELGGIPPGLPGPALYNGYLVTPPRIYAETIAIPMALFVRRHELADSHNTVALIAFTARLWYPGWDLLLQQFNGATGAVAPLEDGVPTDGYGMERLPWGDIFIAWTLSICQGFDGSLWRSSTVTDDLVQVDQQTWGAAGDVIPASRWGRTTCVQPIVDQANDRIVMVDDVVNNAIAVYEFESGDKLRTILLSDEPRTICAEDNRRVYVLGLEGRLNLVDYETGDVLQTARAPFTPDIGGGVKMAFDPQRRRLYFFQMADDSTDGASNQKVYGYYPVPLPVSLTKPIPLKPLRKGRTVPVMTRLIGDIGEAVGGAVVNGEATGDAVMARETAITNQYGEAFLQVTGTGGGSVDITASADVDTGA